MVRPVIQYWTESHPCAYCGATSNTSHVMTCPNGGLYDADGRPIMAKPMVEELPWEQLQLGCG